MKKKYLGEIIENDFDINDFKIIKSIPRKIKTKKVEFFIDGENFKDTINQPFLFIVLPFFATKRERNVNILYEINKGLKFEARLDPNKSLEGFENKQPSDFEKNIFDYIIYKFQEMIFEEKKDDYILFNIKDVLTFLDLKFHSSYYKRVEEALYNLQTTTYNFKIKRTGNIIREVYKEPLNLIRYEKIKEMGATVSVIYKVKLDHRILEELKIKHYSIFDKELLKDIKKSSRTAERIYQYICMKRFDRLEGEFRIETLATIIPLNLYRIERKKNKKGEIREYCVKRTSIIVKNLEKAFEILVEKEYLTSYKIIRLEKERSYKINYIFNPAKDNYCHISTYLKGSQIETKGNNLELDFEFNVLIKEVMKNNYFSEKYNKTSEKKLLKIYNEEGIEKLKDLLDYAFNDLKTFIRGSLSNYIDNLVKKLNNPNPQQLNFDVMSKDNLREQNLDKISKLKKLLESYDLEEKDKIEKKALELYEEELGLKLNKINLKIYSSQNIKFKYIEQAIKSLGENQKEYTEEEKNDIILGYFDKLASDCVEDLKTKAFKDYPEIIIKQYWKDINFVKASIIAYLNKTFNSDLNEISIFLKEKSLS